MSLLFLYENSTAFFNIKDRVYIPRLHFLILNKYSFLLFEPIVNMVRLTAWIWVVQ